jgi:imidazolonepropionase-like amidohydrolase
VIRKIAVGLIACVCLLRGEVRVLKNFTLIDGTGKPAVAGSALIMDNGRITWVGPAAQLKAPEGAEVVDLSGKFVMPGLINLHGHLGNTVDLTQDRKFYTRETIERDLKTYASYGVTTVQSLGTDQDEIFKVRSEQRAGRPTMTRVYTAGQGFVFPGGYGGMAGVTPAIATVQEVGPAVAAQADKGVDIIKFWMDDHLGEQKKMPYPIAKAIIDAAHKRGIRVAAHIFYLADAKQLVNFGIDGLAHSVRDANVDGALINAMKTHHTWQMAATLTREASVFYYAKTPSFVDDPFFTRGVSPKVVEMLKSPVYQKTFASDPYLSRYPGFLETAKHNLKALADGGVRYGMGTDAGPPGRFPGFFEQWELELMVDAGLKPMQVITAATSSAAEFLRAKDLGTVAVGKWADLLVLDRDPLQNIRNTHAINSVYIAGNKIR